MTKSAKVSWRPLRLRSKKNRYRRASVAGGRADDQQVAGGGGEPGEQVAGVADGADRHLAGAIVGAQHIAAG